MRTSERVGVELQYDVSGACRSSSMQRLALHADGPGTASTADDQALLAGNRIEYEGCKRVHQGEIADYRVVHVSADIS